MAIGFLLQDLHDLPGAANNTLVAQLKKILNQVEKLQCI